MATIPISKTHFRTIVQENLEDPVSNELMARAVTIVPCGHVFNEDTVIKCIAHGNLCPLDRKPIERHLPNYTVRALVETTSSLPPEESHSEEAEAHFLR